MLTPQSTYEFHRGLEPFSSFLKREWKAIAVFGGAFSAILVAAIFLIDPAFFYPRLQTDPLNYWLKAKQLVEHGNTAARWSINDRPFPYAAMPGILRAPALLLFSDFDNQLRAVQLLNIPITVGTSVMSAYIVSWSQPARRHAMLIFLSLAFTLISPVWLVNVMLPLTDAPYAFFTLASIIVARGIICSPKRLRDQKLAILALAVMFVISFALRFTGPAVIVFAAILARGRWSGGRISRKYLIAGFMSLGVVLAVLVLINSDAIFGRYFGEARFFLLHAPKFKALLHLLAVALPTQIVPSFHLGFNHQPVQGTMITHFAETPWDTVWMLVGLAISSVIVAGAWTRRDKLLAEIGYVLVPFTLVALVLPSATRYVMSYQPFIWLFFYYGLVAISGRIGFVRPEWTRNRAVIASLVIGAGAVAVGLRMWRAAGTASPRFMMVHSTDAPAYVRDISKTFRHLRQYLEKLPRDSALLIGVWGTPGRWTAISGLNYYRPDQYLGAVVKKQPVYLLLECGNQESCQINWNEFSLYRLNQLTPWGKFYFTSVYSYATSHARVEVFRVLPAS